MKGNKSKWVRIPLKELNEKLIKGLKVAIKYQEDNPTSEKEHKEFLKGWIIETDKIPRIKIVKE